MAGPGGAQPSFRARDEDGTPAGDEDGTLAGETTPAAYGDPGSYSLPWKLLSPQASRSRARKETLKGQVAEAVNSFHLNPPCHDKIRQMRSLMAAGGEGNRADWREEWLL